MLSRKEQNELYYRHRSEILKYIKFRYKGYDDEIIYNNSILSAIKNYHTLENKESYKPWLYQIVKRKAIDQIRSEQTYRNQEHFLDLIEDIDWKELNEDKNTYSEIKQYRGYIDTHSRIADSQYIKELMKFLPTQKCRDIFTDYIEGYTHKEISQKYNIPIGTSKWYINHSRHIINHKIKLSSWMSRY